MKKEKRIIAAVAILLIIGIVAVNNLLNRPLAYDPKPTEGYKTVFARSSEVMETLTFSDSNQLIGEDNGLKLFYNTAKEELELHNLNSGYIWKTAYQENALRQLCNVTLINTESDNTLAVNNAEQECEITAEKIENGVSLKHFYPAQGFGFTLKLWLEKGRMWALIPIDSVVETDLFSVLSIDVLPYFGAAPAEEKGYILFPDGSGALYNFSQKTVATSPITVDVYSDRITEVDTLLDNRKNGVHPIRLPAYGIRRGSDSLVAYIGDGSASSAITLEPAGYVCNVNRIFASSIYRKVTKVVSEAGISSYQSDGRIGTGDFSVCYQLLSGEASDYSGMASSIRELLDEYGMLPKSDTASGLRLDVVMGAEEETMVGSSYKAVTTLSQLEDMLSTLKLSKSGTTAVLVGWQEQGYGLYPDTGKASSEIGSLKSFKAPDSVDVYLDYNAVLADKGRKGATLRRDGIRNSKRVTILGEESQTYIINANTQLDIFKKLLPDISFNGKYGLSVWGAGSVLYDDYNKHCGMTRQQTANSLSAILDLAGKENNIIVSEPNDYSLKYADFVSNLYQNSSGYHILGETVPFYQMVISGSVPYSLDIAGNLSSDFRLTRLRWAEYGAVPFFAISAEGSSALSETAADVYFAIDFNQQKELIDKTVEEFDKLYSLTENSRLCKHSKLSDGIYRSDYNNGSSVIVNYNDTDFVFNGVTVSAMDYTVIKEGA